MPGSELLGWKVSLPLQIEGNDGWWVIFGSPTNMIKARFANVSDAYRFCKALVEQGAKSDIVRY